MRKTASLVAIFISALFILTSCETMSTRPEVPKNTIGSINLVKPKGSNVFQIVVLNKNGKPVDIKSIIDKKAKQSQKTSDQQSNEIRLFLESGSCVVQVCLPRRPCQPVTIDDDAQCASLGQ